MEEAKTNAGQGLGIAGLIMGIIAIPLAILGCTSVLGLILGTTGIVLSAVGLSQATKSNGVKGLPTAGLVVSVLGTCIAIVWMLLIARVVSDGGKWWSKEGMKFMEEIHQEFGEDLEDAFEELGEELEGLGEELEDKLQDLEYDSEWEERWGDEISDEEFEDVLDTYEDLILDYLRLVPLTEDGDLDALAEYLVISAKALALATKITAISPRLTEEQREKFEELQHKYEDTMEETEDAMEEVHEE